MLMLGPLGCFRKVGAYLNWRQKEEGVFEIPVVGKYKSVKVKGYMPCPLCVIDSELTGEILSMSILASDEAEQR